MFNHRNSSFALETCDDKLEVVIPKDDADKIKLVLNVIGTPPPSISANQLLIQLHSGMGRIFDGLQIFLSLVEGVKVRSYRIAGRMTIGIGLDLESPEAEAIIIAVNKKFGLSLDYKELRDHEERPVKALEPDQINYMLWLALIGVTEKRPDGSTVTFHSLTQGLVNLLNKNCEEGFADIPFKANQLIALQSMVYNAGAGTGLIGKNLCAGLKALQKTGEDIGVIEQILEYSNKQQYVGIANRRLKEAGLFHGDPSAKEIHSYWRPYKRIQPSAFSQLAIEDPMEELPLYPLPSGLQHQTFVGNGSVIVIPGPDDKQLDTTVFGSNKNDQLTATNSSSILLGGDGDDTLTVPNATPTTSRYPYLAGNKGFDTYAFGFSPGHLLIYDSDRQGQLVQQGLTIKGVIFGGQLKVQDRQYKFSRTKNSDGSYWLTMGWGDTNHDVTIPNFAGGQFNLIWTGESTFVTKIYYKENVITLPVGDNVAIGRITIDKPFPYPNGINIDVYNQQGAIIKNIHFTATDLCCVESLRLTQLNNGNFTATWHTTDCDGTLWDTVGIVATPGGEILKNFSVDTPPETGCDKRVCDTVSCVVVSLGFEKFAVIRTARNAAVKPLMGYVFGQIFTVAGQPASKSFLIDQAETQNYGISLVAASVPDKRMAIVMGVYPNTFNSYGYFCNETGTVYDKWFRSDPMVFENIAGLNDGGILLTYAGKEGYQTAIYRPQSGWSQSLLLPRQVDFTFRSVTLNNGNVFLTWTGSGRLVGGFCYGGFINPANKFVMDYFPIDCRQDSYMQAIIRSVTRRANGDTIIITQAWNDPPDYYHNFYSVYFETSAAPTQPPKVNIPQLPIKTAPLLKLPIHVPQTSAATPRARPWLIPWQSATSNAPPPLPPDITELLIAPDPLTGEPVYQFNFKQQNETIASATLYGQPSPCTSADGTRTNVLAADGLSPGGLTAQCRTLPPTWDVVITQSMSSGGQVGFLRGSANVVGGRDWYGIGLFCVLYSGWRFCEITHTKPQQDIWQTINEVARDTAIVTGIEIASRNLQLAGRQIQQCGRPLLGKATEIAGSLVGSVVYTVQSVRACTVSLTPWRTAAELSGRFAASMSSGYVVQRVTESAVGRSLGRAFCFFRRKPVSPPPVYHFYSDGPIQEKAVVRCVRQ